ncbi:methylmalonyl-CoA mutase family protein [Litoribrevibacter albus]|uniref:Fused isobutyryl-CoA mutase n=1 Tax=Litoribrevibacter albus TaxID=1473156 RepID=A0AA37SBC5_9GAMM|nr:methylmalonyl-CoA mutase family protein [Litoribrevibacter albus]GLQ31564.1 Fused isobutyryl-CoA mutase [Litoribrevibacter albus]
MSTDTALDSGRAKDSEQAQQGTKSVSTEPLRFVTAASLFDGHDAAINIMRRLIQARGVEVIHLGHNRSVDDILTAAIEEDADAIAISSYQGGHMEFFKYLHDQLAELDTSHIRIFGGGGGTITPQEIEELHNYGIERVYHPQDGLSMGLEKMIDDVIERTQSAKQNRLAKLLPYTTKHQAIQNLISRTKDAPLDKAHKLTISQTLSALENHTLSGEELVTLKEQLQQGFPAAPVIGITGTGGAGKSSLTDELLNRFCEQLPDKKIAILAIDPTRRRSGGALLGDRIRMNSLRADNLYMRSMATRRQNLATSALLSDAIDLLKHSGFDLVIIETAGIGQSDSEIVDLVDIATYVMTSEFGAASQLEKIDMLDFADVIVINKFERKGSQDALRDVRKQYRRNHNEFTLPDEALPVHATIASQFNDPGVNHLFATLCERLSKMTQENGIKTSWPHKMEGTATLPKGLALIPGERVRYLSEIAQQGRDTKQAIQHKAAAARKVKEYYSCLTLLDDPQRPECLSAYTEQQLQSTDQSNPSIQTIRDAYQEALNQLSSQEIYGLKNWDALIEGVQKEQYDYQVRDNKVTGNNYLTSLSGNAIPKVAAPDYQDWGERLSFLLRENLPGYYPFTAGVFPYRRTGEDPIRMFAGEGTPERTNRRFHYIAEGQPATRLSTAFDSVTLYGHNPDPRPDIYGKVGNSGVSISNLDDMKKLYSGFDLCAPTTSVSMTINGPAPIILAFFVNAAIDQQVEKYITENDLWTEVDRQLQDLFKDQKRPEYQGALPSNNDGLGLALLGVTGDQVIDQATYQQIKADTLKKIRGTVQADILKEDQAQNTCIFSTEFAMQMMGDIQQYFIDHQVRNFYSVSISGYHIAEAGANPISQLAFTLANGFTIVEYYLSRGMAIDDFAPNLSFFFSNGMDPEYAVIGRVARRIWARAMKERYGASERSQKLKYHIQTSGRSLHAQEIQFNDIRTTLQALYALLDNCNSLHTNAYDEAITTPTEESVRRAVAIQLIINKELGLNYCENALQGSYLINQLTDLVEEAVFKEFDALTERGGVLGAMDTMYQRSKIQDESMLYEHRKHDGSLPLIGVNTFLSQQDQQENLSSIELMRSTDEEKEQQIQQLAAFHQRHLTDKEKALNELKAAAKSKQNSFECLLNTVKCASLGEICDALFSVGGEYRRNM